ncbi:hypothetical protein [Rummeliibacillus sp. TYF-LIM-RU47]|uniref:hypothetical protein n=1 Tax=Rummeliibacillus sp. TYF-LIM-RU47 TaxID=2608406 RepID=UPI001239507B|nr:hypothetical protein [Rummeliibacillus sp. TYF-LIM-RU47]
MANNKKKKSNNLDREEFGYGYDISPDDLDVIGQNNSAKDKNDNENKDIPTNKTNPSRLNE